jgi:CCT motif
VNTADLDGDQSLTAGTGTGTGAGGGPEAEVAIANTLPGAGAGAGAGAGHVGRIHHASTSATLPAPHPASYYTFHAQNNAGFLGQPLPPQAASASVSGLGLGLGLGDATAEADKIKTGSSSSGSGSGSNSANIIGSPPTSYGPGGMLSIMYNPDGTIRDAESIPRPVNPRVAGYVGVYSPEARKERIARFLAKRDKRVWTKKVKYDVRKNFADSRVRVKGRFVKKEDEATLKVPSLDIDAAGSLVPGAPEHEQGLGPVDNFAKLGTSNPIASIA